MPLNNGRQGVTATFACYTSYPMRPSTRLSLSAILLSLLCFSTYAQKRTPTDWKNLANANHARSRKLVGVGATYLGLTAKAGYFPANRLWAEGELHSLLSDRLEGGIFARYYFLNVTGVSAFALGGVTYGRFQAWDWDFDDIRPETPTRYHSAKLNAGLGQEISLTRRFALEGVAKIGRLTDANWYQPSLQASLNNSF